jgi:hypothetical protein
MAATQLYQRLTLLVLSQEGQNAVTDDGLHCTRVDTPRVMRSTRSCLAKQEDSHSRSSETRAASFSTVCYAYVDAIIMT